jgi:hypothetical protein
MKQPQRRKYEDKNVLQHKEGKEKRQTREN